MLQRVLLPSLALLIAGFAPLVARADPLEDGALVAVVAASNATAPNMYVLDAVGALRGWFFSPFAASDIAVDHAGRVLFGASTDGTIVVTDSIGSLVALIPTPVAHVNGLAVSRNGDLIVSDGNTFVRLSPVGALIEAVTSPVTLPASGYNGSKFGLGADGNDGVVFSIAPASYGDFFKLGFFNLRTQTLTTVTTSLSAISGLDAVGNGEFVVVGSTQSYGANSIYRFGRDGAVLEQSAGPDGISSIAFADLPEPNVASAACAACAALTLLGRARRRAPQPAV